MSPILWHDKPVVQSSLWRAVLAAAIMEAGVLLILGGFLIW